MDDEIISGLTVIAILYGIGFFVNFLNPNIYITLIISFVGVALIVGLSIRIDEQEKKRKKEHKAILEDLKRIKNELLELNNPP